MASDQPYFLIVEELHLTALRRYGHNETTLFDLSKLKNVLSEEDIVELLRLNDSSFLSKNFSTNFLTNVWEYGSFFSQDWFGGKFLLNGNVTEKNKTEYLELNAMYSVACKRNENSSPFSDTSTRIQANEKTDQNSLGFRFQDIGSNRILLVLKTRSLMGIDRLSFLRELLKVFYTLEAIKDVSKRKTFREYVKFLT